MPITMRDDYFVSAADLKAARENANHDRQRKVQPLREPDEREPWLLPGQILDVPFTREY